MNHHCGGDFFASLKLYRCLYDGNFTAINSMPTTCPLCNRPVAGKLHKMASIKVETVTSIWLPFCEEWAEIRRETTEVEHERSHPIETGGTLGYD